MAEAKNAPLAVEVLRLDVTAHGVEGEVALTLAPGTRAEAQGGALDRALSGPLADAATELGVVLTARPSAFAFVQPGKDDQGRTRFVVRGRAEGGRLVPARRP